jgi:hypothetical protein
MIQKSSRFTIISIFCLTAGILMFLIQKNWIVVYWNFGTVEGDAPLQKKDVSTRKKVTIYFWKDEKFKHEDTVIIWSSGNSNENLKHLINAWLSTQLDEKIFTKKIDLEYVAVSAQDQEAFISLNQCFDWDEWSIFEKYKLIESLLKTINNAASEIRYISLLVNNKTLEDVHLSFLQPWPTDGFKN